MFSKTLLAQATRLLNLCRKQDVMLATAESCTGGLIAGLLTEIPGSSDVVDRGFVTYSNASKHELLKVKLATLTRFGAVSGETVKEMAEGAIKQSGAQLGIAVTGIAGPGGGTKAKPVGLVHIAVACKKAKTLVKAFHFKGDRGAIRLATVQEALALAITALNRSA